MKPSNFIHQIETISHWLIYALVLFLFGSEISEMLNSGNVEVKNILTFFIYLEIMQMVSIFFETGKIPVRYPIYISMIGLARYIILEDLNVNEALAISGSILLLSLALVGLAYRTKLVKAGDNEE
ncbi:MAG: phosphate-starvation-inducible E [Candidatus Marinimicrobia bacterium]|nr:phosphate-starvation-inducible E [Candidatus Neomarinimicrobiota bacterium]|tara:strand:- start:684 stop:1058 length:375 start_codon:yes stop_codon:yes gene_type:complete